MLFAFYVFSSKEAKRKAHNFGGVNVLVHPENGFALKGGHHWGVRVYFVIRGSGSLKVEVLRGS